MEGVGWPEDGSELRSISESVMLTCLLEDYPGLKRLVLGDGLYRQRALAREYLLQVTLAVGVEVLGHDDGSIEVLG